MRVFVKKSILFLFPVFIIILFPFVIFFYNGEFISTKKIVDMQLNGELVLLGKILPNIGDRYSKLEILKEKKPDVITLGNSRVLQIRSKFFNNETVFFNGGGISNLRGFKDVLEKLSDDEKPDVIIVGLEQSYFSIASEQEDIMDLAVDQSEANFTLTIVNGWRNFYKDLFNGKYQLSKFFIKDNGIKKIGIRANLKNFGTINDGSLYYGDYLVSINDPNNEDYHFEDTLRRIEKGSNLFFQGDRTSEKSLILLSDFLSYCSDNNIYVIGFLPPYAQEIYDKMYASGKYEYVFNLKKYLSPVFKQYNYNFFDFTNMSFFGAPKEEIIDGLHASEKAYLRLFIEMAENDDKLGDLVDIGYLKNKLKDEKGNYDVFKF